MLPTVVHCPVSHVADGKQRVLEHMDDLAFDLLRRPNIASAVDNQRFIQMRGESLRMGDGRRGIGNSVTTPLANVLSRNLR